MSDVPAAPDTLSDYTLQTLMPLWMDNLYKNLPKIRDGLNLEDLPLKKAPAIVVGGGPSLQYFKHLEMIRKSGWKHTILACDKSLRDCLVHKIVPYATATVDGSPQIAGFYSSGIVRQHAKDIHGIFGLFTHPTVIAAWMKGGGKPNWFTPLIDPPNTPEGKLNPRTISFALWLLSKNKVMMSGLGNVGGMCFHPLTLIHTMDGVKPIDSIKESDSVLTHEGDWQPVRQIHIRPYDGVLLKIVLHGFGKNFPLHVTPEHMFYVQHDAYPYIKKTAGALKKGDYVMIPFPRGIAPTEIDSYAILCQNAPYSVHRKRKRSTHLNEQILELHAQNLSNYKIAKQLHIDWHHVKAVIQNPAEYLDDQLVPYRPVIDGYFVRFTFGRKRIPKRIALTPAFCRLVGYYLAEGSASRVSNNHDGHKRVGYVVTWDFGNSITEWKYINDVSELSQDILGIKLKIIKSERKNRLYTGNAALGFLFRHLFGVGASNKKLPSSFLNLPNACLEQLIIGWMRGDGYSGQLTGTTVSRTLAFQLLLASYKIGLTPGLYVDNGAFRIRYISSIRRDWLAKEAFGILLSPPNFKFKTTRRFLIEKNGIAVPISGITQFHYKGPVYNLGIEDTHSYTANLVAVSNCWNIAYALEADPIILVGFDFSEQVKDKAEAVYFQPYTNMFMQKYKPDEAQDKAAALHQIEENPDFIAETDDPPYYERGKPVRYLVNPTWKLYRKKLAQHITTSGRLTINASGNGCLHTQAKEKDEKGVEQFILQTPNFKAMSLSNVLEEYK